MEEIRERQQYVTLELHDAQLERLEALMERNLARQETMYSDLKGEIKLLSVKFDAKIDGLREAILLTNKRISNLNTNKFLNTVLWMIAAATWICALPAVVSLISLLK